jgi:hypothetical protein
MVGRQHKLYTPIYETITLIADDGTIILCGEMLVICPICHLPCVGRYCPRTNVAQEQDFSFESQFFRRRSGRGQIGYQTRVYGDEILRLLKSYNESEIQIVLTQMGFLKSSTRLDVYQQRKAEEQKLQNNSKNGYTGIQEVSKLFQ